MWGGFSRLPAPRAGKANLISQHQLVGSLELGNLYMAGARLERSEAQQRLMDCPDEMPCAFATSQVVPLEVVINPIFRWDPWWPSDGQSPASKKVGHLRWSEWLNEWFLKGSYSSKFVVPTRLLR
jgi:hypothetical protein